MTTRRALLTLAAAGFLPASPALRPCRLYGVATGKSLDHLNRNDARAAIKTCFDIVGRQKGFELDSRVDIADTVPEIRQRLVDHTVDLIQLCATEFFELESSRLAAPSLALLQGEKQGPSYSYLFLVDSSSGITSLRTLQGRPVLLSSRTAVNTAGAWLDVLLNRERLGRAPSFFASVKPAPTPQGCILPVFFGNAGACVVDEVNFRLALEMNPQLARLQPIERSRPLLERLIAMPLEPHPYRQELLDAMLTLHQDPRGRQLLMIMKCDRLVPLQPGDLDSTRELWKDYARLAPAESPHTLEVR